MITTQDLNEFREDIKNDLRDFKKDIETKFNDFKKDQTEKMELKKNTLKVEAWIIAILLVFILTGTVANLVKNESNKNEITYTKQTVAIVVNTVEFIALKQERAEYVEKKDTLMMAKTDERIRLCNNELMELKKTILPLIYTARGFKNE